MTHGIKYKWLLLLSIWGGCFLLCFINVDTINNILDSREKREILQKDMVFWKQNADNISGVIERQRLLSHEIDSLKLGMVFLNNAFNILATDFNLTDLKVEMDSGLSQGDSIPIKTSFKCTLKNGLDAIQKIQTKYNFLPFRSVKIEEGVTEKSFKFDVSLDYKYHIINM